MSKSRAKILGSRARVVTTVKLDIGGEEVAVELREPSNALKADIAGRAGLKADADREPTPDEVVRLAVHTVIACAYEPGAIVPMFKVEDAAALTASQHFDVLFPEVIKVLNAGADAGNA